MDFVLIFRTLLRKWWLLLLIPMLTAVSTYTILKLSDKKYRSVAQLATGFTQENNLSLRDERFNYLESNLKFENLIQSMISDQVLSLVSYRLALHDIKNPDDRFRKIKDNKKTNIIASDSVKVAKTLAEKKEDIEILSSYDDFENDIKEWLKDIDYDTWSLYKAFTIERIGNTDFVSVEFISENPELSAYAVNAMCEEFLRYNRRLNESKSEESLTYFSELVKEKKKILDEKTEAFNNFKRVNQLSDYSLEGETRIAQISDYEIKKQEELQNIQALKISIQQLERDLSNVERKTKTNTSSNSSIIELRKKINDLNKIYVDGGSKDQNLYNQIENLRERLQIEMANLADYNKVESDVSDPEEIREKLAQKKLDLQIAQANLQSINNSLLSTRSELSGYSSKEAEISILKEELEAAKKEHQLAVSKYNEAKSKANISGGSVSQILKGVPVRDPVSSKSLLILILACFASFGLTAFFIVVMELMDFRIKSPKQFVTATKLKLSGFLPEIKIKNKNLKEIFYAEHNEEMAYFKQSLRKIRFEIEEEESCKRILVTSIKKNEGKTFFILCLAYSISLLKKRVLIVDTNFKNNTLTNLLMAEAGFQELLKEDTTKYIGSPDKEEEEKEYSRNIISKTAMKDIDVIGTVNTQDSPSEILSGKNFEGLLRSISGKYDYILMEGAAMNDYSDTKELIAYADKVIPVFSADETIGQIDRDAIKFLKSLNGKLVGAVLNKVKSENV
ncbi:MAG: Wzz/FepE/Etk N-terminal domain-containing protein [Fulvivirga sp.]|nr:Wzz/FepE/Etk N-terminal domain-containing protein [Fulvivirga sp.]